MSLLTELIKRKEIRKREIKNYSKQEEDLRRKLDSALYWKKEAETALTHLNGQIEKLTLKERK